MRVGRPQAVRLQTDGDSAAACRQRKKVAQRRAGDLAGGVGDAARRAHPPQQIRTLDTGPYTVDFMNGFSVGWLLACCPAVGVGKQLVGPDTGSTLTRSSEAPAAGAPLLC